MALYFMGNDDYNNYSQNELRIKSENFKGACISFDF